MHGLRESRLAAVAGHGAVVNPWAASIARGSGGARSLVRGGMARAGLGYLLLTVVLTYPLLGNFTTAIPGDSFDGWQNYWNQWWIKTAIVDRHISPYFTDLLYAPTGVSLLFHTLNPFNGLTTLPIQLAWGLIPAYNLAVLFSFVAGGLGAYLLARKALGSGRGGNLAAFAAGAIFTFAPYHFAHLLGHLQLIALEWIPFYALYLWRLVGARSKAAACGNGRTIHDGLMAGLFLVLVGLCDWYYVLYCLILTGLALAWRGGLGLREQAGGSFWRPVAGAALAGLFFFVALGALVVPMVAEARQSHFMVPDPGQSRLLSADLLAFITPQEFHPLWGAWARQQAAVFTATVAEHQVFAGYSTLLLAALGLWQARRARGKSAAGPTRATGIPNSGHAGLGHDAEPVHSAYFWLVVVLVFLLLALGPVLHVAGRSDLLPGGREIRLPYSWLATLPFLNIARSVSRFDVMVMLGLAVLAGFGIKWLASRGRWGAWAGIVAATLVIFEFWPAPYPLSPPDTPAWYGALAADARPGTVLNLPMNWDRPWYLLYQTVHHKALAVAYISRDDPRTLTERAPVLQHFRHLGPDIIDFDLAGQGQAVLADLGIRWVVLDRYKMPGARERDYNETTAGLIFGGQQPVYHDERLTVFAVTSVAPPAPYAILGSDWGPLVQETRTFTGQATVIVQAPAAGEAQLAVTLAPGSAALTAPQVNGRYILPVQLRDGDNQVALQGVRRDAQVTVSHLAVVAER